MTRYTPPLDDMNFLAFELFEADHLTELPGYEEAARDLIEPVLEEAGRFAGEVLYPLNQSGDREGCVRHDDGRVSTPTGFKEAYTLFCENGWNGVGADEKWGGMGLPKYVSAFINEMICSANLSFSLYPGLTYGAYKALTFHGSDDLRETFLPNLVNGVWSGTMCLTEPQCGTDLGMIKTKAIPDDTGTYKITGTKIFISAGEHDLSENIIHLVLAKLPDAPFGTKGISLFVVPKLINGKANHVSCGSLEHKMGIHGAATCEMVFDEAVGYLVGAPNKGMSYMFTMMNQERLDVGIQGLGVGEIARQGAVDYARERLQGRSLTGAKYPDLAADPIIVHPDVRRMLLRQKSLIEGCRALATWAAIELDHALKNPDPERAQAADEFVQLMTPIIKAFLTDCGTESASLGMQVYGGHGYIVEHGMEQYLRDARIAQIYEGTNGIQALDLVGRKMPFQGGRLLRRFFHPVGQFLDNHAQAPFAPALAKAYGRLQKASAFIAQKGLKNPDEAGAAATDYLRLFALVALGYLWARMMVVSQDKDDDFHQAKLDTGTFFMQKVLPETGALLSCILSGSASLMAPKDDAI